MSVTDKIVRDPYLSINIALASVILFIYICSLIFSPDTNHYPIGSTFDKYTGQTSASTGLSRAFSCIMRGRFSEARIYNSYSIQIFTFFTIQFALRIFMIFFTGRVGNDYRLFVFLDAVISISLFIIYFFPFFHEMFSGINKNNIQIVMMHNGCFKLIIT